MSTKLLGRRNTRRRRIFVGPVLLVGLIVLLAATVAQAVHDDNLFELGPAQGADILGDGNAANGPDWGDLFDATGGGSGDLFGGLAATFLLDDTSQKGATDRTTFSGAGGSNKNNDPISTLDCATHVPPLTGSACDTWHWDGGNVPPKDDLVNSYAYAAMPTSGDLANHLILYAGLERLDESGDSHVDFEFLQNPVNIVDGAVSGALAVPCNDPGSDPTPCEFSGVRQIDDVIVSMDFVRGGGLGSVEVRRWDGHEYVLEGVEGGEGCNVEDTICAFNNGALIDGGPWPNIDKSGNTVTNLLPNAFTEIGVDVTALLGETPCISTVTNKTRSSASFTAELKDFSAPRSFPICGGKISIGPDDVNEVGQSHTFTVNVAKTIGNAEEPVPDGTIVDVELTDANGAVSQISSNTCASPGTVGGACTITFKSDAAGTVTAHASADFDADGISIHVETDATGKNSGDAVKRFVDAKISIGPDDTNSIGESHTFTVSVQQDDGLAANAPGGDAANGFGPAPNGTAPTVTLIDSNGAISTGVVNTCGGIGTISGICTVTFTSNTAGTVTGHASVTLLVGGLSLTRATDGTGSNSDDAVKNFVSGSIAWKKVDNANVLQGGATFEVCRTHTLNTATGTFVDTADVCFSVTDDSAPDTDADAGEFKVTGLVLGRYTVRETAAPAGFEPDPNTRTVEITIASPEATIQTSFVNQRPILKITGFGYTNEATGSPTAGVRSGTATYTVNLRNYGGAAAVLTNSSLNVTRTGSGGTVTCGAANDPVPFTRNITGTIAANTALSPPVTVTCTYTNVGDGTQIVATLNVNYTTNGMERAASGSPAMVSFTVQGD